MWIRQKLSNILTPAATLLAVRIRGWVRESGIGDSQSRPAGKGERDLALFEV